ncbi:digestive organ expansion factor [Histomonas meleagridis]|uniref:digestive organ expansion factor n=1 Tax=Histomonas meleagridis TaxID=135588 RepID=UPI00355A49E0|nr:digestive organ expansion factor [Histomonas meleagridis]KAH0805568.1 digestive organ expansion factor [Histomonas meleagridis]
MTKKRTASDFLALLSQIVVEEPNDQGGVSNEPDVIVEDEEEVYSNLPNINFSGSPINFNDWFNAENHDFNAPKPEPVIYQHEQKIVLSTSSTIPKEKPLLFNSLQPNSNEEFFKNDFIPSLFDYRDFFYIGDDFENYRHPSVLHVINHIYSDLYIKKHRPRDDVRDTTYTMTTVLVICPTRYQAYQFINDIIHFLPKTTEDGTPFEIQNLDRLQNEYTIEELPQFIQRTKPKDWLRTFGGNNSNEFKMGIRFHEHKIELFHQMSRSQLVIASSLSLFLHDDMDFMSSIEVLILDSLDVLLMQNSDRLLQLISMLNKLPQKVTETDWKHLRLYCTDKQQHKMRQNIIYSSVLTPEIHNMFSRFENIRGQILIRPKKYPPLLLPGLERNFKRLSCANIKNIGDTIERCFREKIFFLIKQWRSEPEEVAKRTIVYFVSTYRFLQARKMLEDNMIGFLELSDESTDEDNKRMKRAFRDDKNAVMLMTERFYFHYRPKLRQIERVVFIQPPTFQQFVGELAGNCTATFYFTEFDEGALERVVGSDVYGKILQSEFYTI